MGRLRLVMFAVVMSGFGAYLARAETVLKALETEPYTFSESRCSLDSKNLKILLRQEKSRLEIVVNAQTFMSLLPNPAVQLKLSGDLVGQVAFTDRRERTWVINPRFHKQSQCNLSFSRIRKDAHRRVNFELSVVCENLFPEDPEDVGVNDFEIKRDPIVCRVSNSSN